MRDNDKDNDYVHDEGDYELIAALSQYAAVEPRPGLEERILANLRTERQRNLNSFAWHWVAAGFALMLMIALGLAWKSYKPRSVNVAHLPSIPAQSVQPQPSQLAMYDSEVPPQKERSPAAAKTEAHRDHLRTKAIVEPRLDQFPTPQPLSQQEIILANYVAEQHQQAILVARARMAALKQDLAEELAETSTSANPAISEPAADHAR